MIASTHIDSVESVFFTFFFLHLLFDIFRIKYENCVEFLINSRGTKIESKELTGGGGGRKKKLNSFADCESTCARANVPSTCRANKPAVLIHATLQSPSEIERISARRYHASSHTRNLQHAGELVFVYTVSRLLPGKLRIWTLRCALETVLRENVNLILS